MGVNHSALVSHRRLGRQPLIVAALLQLDYGDGLAPRGIADVTQDGMLLAIYPGVKSDHLPDHIRCIWMPVPRSDSYFLAGGPSRHLKAWPVSATTVSFASTVMSAW